MSAFLQDLRFGIRLLLKDRSFTITALLTLAVCIGANAAMFSIVRSVVLKPLPFPGSERVVLLYNSYPNAGAPRVGAATPDYFDRLEGMPSLDQQALFRREGMTFGDENGVERLVAIRATRSFFSLVQAHPAAGRVFTAEEEEPGKNRVVILSYGYWQRKFGAAPIQGKTMRLNGQPFEIVGVMPSGFSFLQDDVDLFVPAAFAPADKGDDRRHNNNWQMVGRLAPGASVTLAQQQVDALNARNDERFPEFKQILKDARFRTVVVNLQEDLVRDVRNVLFLLWGGVGVVLVIGCVNIANLVMVRSSGRTRELATRHAIGGSLSRLARQLTTEMVLLALIGGAFGVLIGWWTIRSVAAINVDQLPRGYEIAFDWVSVGGIALLTIVVGLALGLVSVLRLRRMNLNVELREESRGGTSSRRANFVRRVLAMVQVALALALLVGAGLLLASFRAVMAMDLGFDPANVSTANVNVPNVDNPAMVSFERRALDALTAIPGVEAAGGTTALPFSGALSPNVILAEGYVMKPGESLLAPMSVFATRGYFEAMHMALARGRFFDARDTDTAPASAVIDERLAQKFWPDQDPIGRRLYRPEDPKDITRITKDTKFINVVGVVKNSMFLDPRQDFTPVGTYYLAFEQNPSRGLTFAVRSGHPSPTLQNDIRRAIASVDPTLAVFASRPMQEWIDRALVSRRVPMLIATAFGGVALFLSAVGIYGVLAYSVAQRRRELGVRMALGGSAGSIFGLVLGDGLRIVGIGLAAGLAGAFFVGQLMKSQLYQVTPMNPLVVAGVTLVLSVVALIASSLPALRASRINPIVVLSK